MTPLRIGIVCHASLGGSVRIAISLANALSARGHRVHLFSPHLNNHSALLAPNLFQHTLAGADLGRSPGELHVQWSAAERASFSDLLEAACRDQELDILHFHYASPFAEILAGLRERLGDACPSLVGTLHGTDIYLLGRDSVQQPTIRAALLQMDALTAVSFNHAELAETLYSLPSQLEVITNFLDLADWQPGGPFRPPAGRPWRLVHLSNFRPVKSVVDVGRIFHALSKAMDAELWLLGDGPEHASLMTYARESGFEKQVRAYGITGSPAQLLQQTDLMLITSGYESFCMAALEAMACGVPVLAPRVGGLPEVVRDGLDGLLYPPGEIAIAGEMARSLLEDPDRRATMAAQAVQRAKEFTAEIVIPQYEALYQQLSAQS